ncbi:MAG: imidazole glycerol phosphate synthase subunit HisH [Paracoccaceae bacterium]
MSTVIIDYGSGNLRSAEKSFQRVASAAVEVVSDPGAVRAADRIVLPGVGAFADCRAGLDAIPGMLEALEEAVLGRGVPFLGICVGMQLLADRGREHSVETAGLGWIGGEVVRLAPNDATLKVPHMGWNALEVIRPHPVLEGIGSGTDMYFVHSYHLEPADPAALVATVEHGQKVTAAVARDNIFGVQFHPEKSQADGLRLIANFLRWKV